MMVIYYYLCSFTCYQLVNCAPDRFLLPADGLELRHDLRTEPHLFSKVSVKRVLVFLLVGNVARLQSAQPLVSERRDVKRLGVNVDVFIIWDVCVGICRLSGRRHVFLKATRGASWVTRVIETSAYYV